jgi:hypothetical protein
MRTEFGQKNAKERDHLENLDIDWILQEWCGLDSSDSGQGPLLGLCEHDNKISSSIKVKM